MPAQQPYTEPTSLGMSAWIADTSRGQTNNARERDRLIERLAERIAEARAWVERLDAALGKKR